MDIRRELTCMRCQTVRHEHYVHSTYGLEKTGQSYSYPEHYQMKGVPRGVKPSAIIQDEQYRRSMERIAQLAREA